VPGALLVLAASCARRAAVLDDGRLHGGGLHVFQSASERLLTLTTLVSANIQQ
jgi:hypothetical protein